MKQKFGLVGHHIIHSISPFIHERLFTLSKIPAEYKLFDIYPDNFTDFWAKLKQLDGYNVTIPYKQKIIPFLDKLCGKADIYKSVNTVKNDGVALGYNTDADGFLSALNFEKIEFGKNVTILGCGGVARIFCFEAIFQGSTVTLAVRKESYTNAKKLANDAKKLTNRTIGITYLEELPKNIDLLINATPVGMFPQIDQCPIADSNIWNCKAVFDAIYNPIETLLIKKANSNGAKVATGLSMLVFQAVFAHKVWNEATFADADICQLIADSKKFLKKFG